MIALLIIGIMLTSLFALQNNSFFSFMRYHTQASHMLFMQNEAQAVLNQVFLKAIELPKKLPFKEEKKYDDQNKTLHIKYDALAEKSSLKNIPQLIRITMESSFSIALSTYTEKLFYLVYNPVDE